ncbi:hypothetical protein SAMN02746065_1604 [Desulfocicer vacuolatum DSM 3385]|uniref:Zinc-finger of transposase IS204/IS1001/IS1096/IS1165 n=1 Tax=Desulfocicer vacuolatum DSM 3385 TaxID=1121400 RepID=A0A1W2EYW0_9BACT|nr:hypothetical protein SAMN02746065_1604 [Desulfocicer vacuolatum DSM 3385]
MIQFVDVILKKIFEQGKEYPWERPCACPKCGSSGKVWSHGYVRAIFDGFRTHLFLKRYRCHICRCVITLRPLSHYSRFQSSRKTIRSSLDHRIKTGRWPKSDVCTARMRHWLRNLQNQVMAVLDCSWSFGLMSGYDKLLEMERIPVSRSI